MKRGSAVHGEEEIDPGILVGAHAGKWGWDGHEEAQIKSPRSWRGQTELRVG